MSHIIATRIVLGISLWLGVVLIVFVWHECLQHTNAWDKIVTWYLRTKTRLYGFCPDCGCKRSRTSVICILCGFDHWSR